MVKATPVHVAKSAMRSLDLTRKSYNDLDDWQMHCVDDVYFGSDIKIQNQIDNCFDNFNGRLSDCVANIPEAQDCLY